MSKKLRIDHPSSLGLPNRQPNFSMPENSIYKSPLGLNKQVIKNISNIKNEPAWMLALRLKAYEIFKAKPLPNWGGDLKPINFNKFHYYLRPTETTTQTWKDVPSDIRETFDRLGIPEAEKKYLAGVGNQYESEMVYHSLETTLKKQGVIFTDTDTALREYPEIFKKYFGTVISIADNKFSALNSAVWSGGSFIYVPKNVEVTLPLQAYFRINARRMGQFERTLIIADEGSKVHYVEGCTAPTYSTQALHSAVVEIIVKRGAQVRYTTIQNWSHNVYNLVTKRAYVYADGVMEWIDGNLGSKLTMKYPAIYLMEPGARGDILTLAMAGNNQHQDAGAKIIHIAPRTSSSVISKSLSYNGGRTTYRGLVKVYPQAKDVKTRTVCDALMLDNRSRSDTYPVADIKNNSVISSHEATVGKINAEQLFYLQSRGLNELEAHQLIVNGFLEPVAKTLPMEYAVELNRLVKLEMEHAIT